MLNTQEKELVRRAQNGDTEAFGALVVEHQQFVYNLALRAGNDPHETEDIAQEAFVRAWLALPNFRGQSQFRTWLYRIVTNASLDRLKQRKRKTNRYVRIDNPESMQAMTSTAATDSIDLTMHMERALHELPTLQRAVVILRHIDGLSTRTVSEILQCSEGTVKTHLHRGLKKMRSLLQFVKEGTS